MLQRLPTAHSTLLILIPTTSNACSGAASVTGSTRGARSYAELPAEAVKYVRRIEELVEAPVTLLSTSPERDDTILVRDPFAD